jgi:hypothetical protein
MTMVLRTNMIWQSRHTPYYISKSGHCWWRDNNYTKKLVIEKLNQITYDFLKI